MKEHCTSKPTNSNANEVIELDGVEEEKHKSLGGGIHVAGEMERLRTKGICKKKKEGSCSGVDSKSALYFQLLISFPRLRE